MHAPLLRTSLRVALTSLALSACGGAPRQSASTAPPAPVGTPVASPAPVQEEPPVREPQTLVGSPTPRAPVRAPGALPYAPSADEHSSTQTLDALVDWVIAHDVEALAVEVSGTSRDESAPAPTLVAITAGGASSACRGTTCFALPGVDAVQHVDDAELEVVLTASPDRLTTWAWSVRGDRATAQPVSTRDRIRPALARPPFRDRPARGATITLAPSTPALDGLAEALWAFSSAGTGYVRTIRDGERRVTVVGHRDEDGGGEHVTLLRGPNGIARTEQELGVYELGDPIQGFAGEFVLLRATSPSGRGWRDELWSVSASGARAEVYAVPLGGAEDGDECEPDDPHACVWLRSCERPLVVDDPEHAHLGPPVAWQAEHRDGTARWAFHDLPGPMVHCDGDAPLCRTATGLRECGE